MFNDAIYIDKDVSRNNFCHIKYFLPMLSYSQKWPNSTVYISENSKLVRLFTSFLWLWFKLRDRVRSIIIEARNRIRVGDRVSCKRFG